MAKRTQLISVFLIALVGLSLYVNSLGGEFIYDDIPLVRDNAHIKILSNIKIILTRDIAAGAGVTYYFYRPLQIFTYALDYSLWKLNPLGYHLTNILIHILVALCIYWLVSILFAGNTLPLLTSLLFVAHPVNTEAVSYISGRADLLAAVFILSSMVLYIKGGFRNYIFSCILFVLALLSKEGSLILILLLLWYYYAFNKKVNAGKIIFLLFIAAIYLSLRIVLYKTIVSPLIYPTTFLQRLPGVFVSLTKYSMLLLLPFNLHMEYGLRFFNFFDARAISGAAILAICFIYLFRHRALKGVIFFSLGWFLIALLPVSNIYPINAYMAEHWLYLPSLGFFLILASGLSSLYKIKKYRIVSILIIAALAASYSYLTVRQNNYWREPISFYKRTLEYAPDSQQIYNNLGRAYNDLGRTQDAIEAFNKSIDLDHSYFKVYYGVGNIPSSADKENKPVSAFNKDLELKPRSADAYYNLGSIYYRLGKKEEATAFFKKVVAVDRNYAAAHNSLAVLYYQNKDYLLALRHCELAIRLGAQVDPALVKAIKWQVKGG